VSWCPKCPLEDDHGPAGLTPGRTANSGIPWTRPASALNFATLRLLPSLCNIDHISIVRSALRRHLSLISPATAPGSGASSLSARHVCLRPRPPTFPGFSRPASRPEPPRWPPAPTGSRGKTRPLSRCRAALHVWGFNWTRRNGSAAEQLSARSFTLDGGTVVHAPGGIAIFDALHRHGTVSEAMPYASDLLEIDGEDLRTFRSQASARKARYEARWENPERHLPRCRCRTCRPQ
jgi:hypothetical protein